MTEVVLEVPMRTPSGNQLSGRHWSERARMRKLWEKELWVAMAVAGLRRPAYRRVELTIERYAAQPIKDADNYAAGCKPVLDAMVHIGLLLDDSSAVIASLRLVQFASKRKEERTVFRIRALDPASTESSSPTSAPAPP